MSKVLSNLVCAVLGFFVGLFVIGAIGLMLAGKSNTIELEVPVPAEMICPPFLASAVGINLTFEGPLPKYTPVDLEFFEQCGIEWGAPYMVPPPAEGA